jgi:uncharacterized membrane protein (UPF0127 family)
MKYPYRLVVDRQTVASLRLANTYWARLRGLLGTRRSRGALLISPGNSVHGLGMTYSLDVAQLDVDLTVRHTTTLLPFGLVAPQRGVRHVLEAERGAFARWGLRPGSKLSIDTDIDPGRSEAAGEQP